MRINKIIVNEKKWNYLYFIFKAEILIKLTPKRWKDQVFFGTLVFFMKLVYKEPALKSSKI